MLIKLLRTILSVVFLCRSSFWRAVLSVHGGTLGKNVIIHGGVKLASSRSHPIHIGNDVQIMQGAILSTAQAGTIHIGNHVYIGEYSVITSNCSITIAEAVMIAPHNNIVDFNHTFSDLGTACAQQRFTADPVVIDKGAWVGANCCILKGVTIGEKTTVGAGSVVTKSLPAHCVAAGSPARILKTLSLQNQI